MFVGLCGSGRQYGWETINRRVGHGKAGSFRRGVTGRPSPRCRTAGTVSQSFADGTHIQLDGPIVVWGSLNTHPAAGLKQYQAECDWLTTVRLPPYEPDLNPVEAVWSPLRKAMANAAFTTPDDLDRKLRSDWLERAAHPTV